MVPTLRIRAPLACRMVRFDRDRLNEASARGETPFLPSALPGRTRLLTIPEVVALFIYARLVESDVGSKTAGRVATDVVEIARSIAGHEADVGVSIMHSLTGYRHAGVTLNITIHDGLTAERAKELMDLRDKIQKETRQAVMSPSVLSFNQGDLICRQETWQIAPILKHIQREIEEYRNTLGEEETLG